jgi:hypothetical protein
MVGHGLSGYARVCGSPQIWAVSGPDIGGRIIRKFKGMLGRGAIVAALS